MKMPEPQKQHQWLKQLLGEWTYEGEAIMGPDQPPSKFAGTESVRAIGDLWVVGEGRGDCPGAGSMTAIITIGYDPAKQRFVGSWIGSPMSNMFIYSGTLDPTGKILTLETEGPNPMAEGQLATFQDIIEVKSPDHRVLTSRMRTDDGTWVQFMTAHYRRTK